MNHHKLLTVLKACVLQLLCFSFDKFNCDDTPCPKISSTPDLNTPNSVCRSVILTKYRTLHYLNIAYCHTHCDICTMLCVLGVTSL